MSDSSSLIKSVSPYSTNDRSVKVALSRIDSSLRGPMIFFFSASVIWLLVGTLFAMLASLVLHWTWLRDLFGGVEPLSFGVVRTLHLNAMAYGWATNAAFAVSLWIMARLSRTEVRHLGLLFVAAIFWNVGVLVGIVGIFKGDMLSVEWLEMPAYATPILVFSYAMIGVWGLISFRFRNSEHVYVSQWYILAALFWFPWLYTVAQLMIVFIPARGVVQAITNWWFAHNVLGLFLTPVGLASVYYFMPKVLGKPIHSYYLSVLGFWSLALFYNWAGVHHLVGGPIPVWVQSAGIVASVMMVIPVVVTGINHHVTMIGNFGALKFSPTLRFIVFGAMSYTATSLLGSAMALRDVSVVTHFSHFTVAHAHHGMYAFFTMVMFGAIYYIMPRLMQREWPSVFLIKAHFWTAVVGVTIYIIGMHVGGWIQGWELGKTDTPVVEIAIKTIPWLMSRSVAGIILTASHIFFAIHFFWMLSNSSALRRVGPALFQSTETVKS